MGEVEKLWNEKKRLRRIETSRINNEAAIQAHKESSIGDQQIKIAVATTKLNDVTLTEDEVKELNSTIDKARELIAKYLKKWNM